MSALDLLLRLYPRGLGLAEPGTRVYEDLQVLADGLDAARAERDDLELEILPDTATDAGELTSWERVLAIPRLEATEDLRRAACAAALRFLPDCSPSTYEGILDTHTGLSWTIVEPFAFRCDHVGSLTDTLDDVCDGAFYWYATADETACRLAGLDRDYLDYLCRRMRQAHVYAQLAFDDFDCDDDFSLTDRDVLGV